MNLHTQAPIQQFGTRIKSRMNFVGFVLEVFINQKDSTASRLHSWKDLPLFGTSDDQKKGKKKAEIRCRRGRWYTRLFLSTAVMLATPIAEEANEGREKVGWRRRERG